MTVPPVRSLETAWLVTQRERQRIEVLAELRSEAATMLGRGDVTGCAVALGAFAQVGGPLCCFRPPSTVSDHAAWGAILARLKDTLAEATEHNRTMQERLARHLADPQPWNPAWRLSVQRTSAIQQRHVERWLAARQLLRDDLGADRV